MSGDYECDLLIRGASVFDGTGAPPMTCDVAVAGDRIVAVGSGLTLSAREEVQAEGLALAPGFIDVHTHDDLAAMSLDASLPKLSQGVTTVVTGNCGISLGPTPLGRRDTVVPPLDLIATKDEYRHETFGDFLAAVRATGETGESGSAEAVRPWTIGCPSARTPAATLGRQASVGSRPVRRSRL